MPLNRSCVFAGWSIGLAGMIATSGVAQVEDRTMLRPAADHHVHLRSPAITQLFGEHIPAIELPADLQTLLRDFENHWRARNASGLAGLFTPDGVMQVGRDWQRGPSGIHLAALGRGGSVRFHAQAFGSDAAVGYIAGSYAGNSEPPPGDRGRFLFALRRSTGGAWRIAAATLNELPTETRVPATTVDELITQLDAAGIRQAAVLSWAYQFGAVNRQPTDEREKVRAENDWTAQQVARHPDRFVGFCSFNPLKDYALGELDRCMADSRLSGVKLHFTTAGINLRNSEHVDRLRAVFRAANVRRFPIVVHMRTLEPSYGRADAEVFLNRILPEAPDSTVQIAHLAGWGGYGTETDAAFEVFAKAAAAKDPRVDRVFFDISGVASSGLPDAVKASLVRRLRGAGVSRILFAIDGPVSPEAWSSVAALPLDDGELRIIALNLAPYMRRTH
jgi:predicted TIM-barrel fold metal-dependent hydrolase